MLTKKEIKTMTNEDLIHRLSVMMYSSRVYKCDIENAKRICLELESRNIIETADSLFIRWEKSYRM